MYQNQNLSNLNVNHHTLVSHSGEGTARWCWYQLTGINGSEENFFWFITQFWDYLEMSRMSLLQRHFIALLLSESIYFFITSQKMKSARYYAHAGPYNRPNFSPVLWKVWRWVLLRLCMWYNVPAACILPEPVPGICCEMFKANRPHSQCHVR